MGAQQIYLDHNSTSPIDPRVADAMYLLARKQLVNPASQHEAGRLARRQLESAREQIAQILGASTGGMDTDTLVFTSGGTEANNLALRGLAGRPPGSVILSAIEHPSVVQTAQYLAQQGFAISRMPVNSDGVVDLNALDDLLTNETRLVSVMFGNHETGALQPVAEIANRCRDAGVPFHSDAVQAIGKVPVDFHAIGATAMSFSAHKFHGPKGIGGLILQRGFELRPILFGGFQQAGLRPGTEPVELIVGMAKALEFWHSEQSARLDRLAELRDRFEARLTAHFPSLIVNAGKADRLPHTSNIAFPGYDRQSLVMALDLAGIACSTGSACASGSSETSPVLQAMGCEDELLEGSVRFGFGAFNTQGEVEAAVDRISRVLANQTRRSASPKRPLQTPLARPKTV